MGLFEGIGGFSLSARWAGWKTPVMVEWNQYCQAVLRKNFPDATIFGDIHKFDGRPYAGKIDIITGGFPCQPFSNAGKRAGTDDNRYLWPEMLRVIREVAPTWVVGENVAGLMSMDGGRVFAGILADLENAGYSTEAYTLPAIGLGAPHRRDRVWIIAHSESANDRRKTGIVCGKDGRQIGGLLSESCGTNSRATPHSDHIERDRRGGAWSGRAEPANENCWHTADAIGRGRDRGPDNERQGQASGIGSEKCDSRTYANANGARCEKLDAPAKPGFAGFGSGRINAVASDANNHPGERQRRNGGQILPKQESGGCGASHWREHWYEVATRICGIYDGFPAGVDGAGDVPAKTTKGKAHRLEALGNAIVPQIAYQIFDAINQYHK